MMYASIVIFLIMVLVNLLFKIASFFSAGHTAALCAGRAYPFPGLGTGAGNAGHPNIHWADCAGCSELGDYGTKEDSAKTEAG